MDVLHISRLAHLPLTPTQAVKLQSSLDQVLKLIDHIKKLDTTDVEATSQVTGQTNVTRPDEIDTSRMLSQKEALSQAADQTEGYFRVKSVFSDQ